MVATRNGGKKRRTRRVKRTARSTRKNRRSNRRTNRRMRGGNGFAFAPSVVTGASSSMLANPMPHASYNNCAK